MISYLKARLGIPEEGQSLAEYALILALIAVLAIAALTAMGGKVSTILNQIATAL
jgi:pilus assembly protein Flp/PilA